MNDETVIKEPEFEEEESTGWVCDRCECDMEEDDDSYSVQIGRNQYEEWCEGCRDNHSRPLPEGDGDCSQGYYDNYCFFCERCEEDHYGSGGDNGWCSSCEEEYGDEADDSILGPYSKKAEREFGFFGGECDTNRKWSSFHEPTGYLVHKPTLFFGMELEVECRGRDLSGAVTEIKELLNSFAILKHDGSLDSGFEIVTAPATMPEFKKRTEKFFAEFPALCKKYKLESWNTNTCGLHVHVSRNALSKLQVGKMQSLVTDEHSRAMIKKIAGRTSSYGKYEFKKKIADRDLDRYQAVNIVNPNTIEFRIFRGTTKHEGVMRSIEFCLALVEFSAPGGGMSLKHADGRSEFTKWLSLPAQAKVYPNLVHFLAVRKFVKRHHNKHGLVKGKA